MSRGLAIGGFMGTGKSTIGPLLAERLKVRFVDLDAFIEEAEGVSVSEIFRQRGEGAFRQLETSALESLSKLRPLVLALGGGTLHECGWRELLREFDVVVLCASWDVIRRRIADDEGARPLAAQARRTPGPNDHKSQAFLEKLRLDYQLSIYRDCNARL